MIFWANINRNMYFYVFFQNIKLFVMEKPLIFSFVMILTFFTFFSTSATDPMSFFFLLITSWFFLTSAKNNRENYQKTSKTLIFNFFHFSPLGEKWKKQLFMKNTFSWQNHANMTGHRSWKIHEKTTNVELALTLDY